MIDVAVGRFQAPGLGIGGEIGGHILMHQLLQVEIEGAAIGAHDDIRAHATIRRDVAAGIAEADIGRVVEGGDADLLTRGFDQFAAPVRSGWIFLRPGGGRRQAQQTELQRGSTGKRGHARSPGFAGSWDNSGAIAPFSCSGETAQLPL
ncbi:hypothetical protein X769_27200 [Mesorhizobium sp. LSJC268A00]|nr:hypothetical protein X769_27200 [Mesorhizobium sp. LSJC268A00]